MPLMLTFVNSHLIKFEVFGTEDKVDDTFSTKKKHTKSYFAKYVYEEMSFII